MKSRSAFTLVELLIVIVVIALLAAISVVAYNGIQARARASSVSSALAQTKKKIALWQVDNGTNSPSCSQFYELITGSSNGASCPFDYKDITYQYSNTADTATYCITATSGNTSYKASNTLSPTQGGCSGHGQGGTAAVTNLAVNPSVESNWTGWSQNFGISGTGTAVRMTDGGKSGNAYLRMTWSTAPTVVWGGVSFPSFPATPGKAYYASVWVRTSSAQTIHLSLRANTYSSTPDATGANVHVPANTWTLLTVAQPSTPSEVSSYVPLTIRAGSGSWQPGDILDHDALMITEGSSPTNFADGNSTDWTWNGTPNNSTSTGPAL